MATKRPRGLAARRRRCQKYPTCGALTTRKAACLVCVKAPHKRCRFHKGKPRATTEQVYSWLSNDSDRAHDRYGTAYKTKRNKHIVKAYKKTVKEGAAQNLFLDSITRSRGRMKDGRNLQTARSFLKETMATAMRKVRYARKTRKRGRNRMSEIAEV